MKLTQKAFKRIQDTATFTIFEVRSNGVRVALYTDLNLIDLLLQLVILSRRGNKFFIVPGDGKEYILRAYPELKGDWVQALTESRLDENFQTRISAVAWSVNDFKEMFRKN